LNIILADSFVLALVAIYLAGIVVAFTAIFRAPWFHLKESDSLNILLAMIVGVMVIWTLRAGFAEGLDIHLLGTTLLTLMFGWEFATLSILVVLIAHGLVSGTSWLALPANMLVLGAIPALITQAIFRFADRKLPNNFFIYIFVCAFFGAAASVASVVFLSTAAHWIAGNYDWDFLWRNYTRYVPLAMLPEAFISGMLMSLFVAYRPEWVSTFDDNRYLKDK
jgi:uncharacterized membrane protein